MNSKTHLHFVKSHSQNTISRIDFESLKHAEIRAINSFCKSEIHKEWALGDCFSDWKIFAEMKKDDVLILKIRRGGTHVFPMSEFERYNSLFRHSSINFKITCYDNEGNDFTIEPYEV